MDPIRFDARSRSLGPSHSRRTALAGLLAGPPMFREMPEAAARDKKKHSREGKQAPSPLGAVIDPPVEHRHDG